MKYYDGYPFPTKIRNYNNALALASIGCHEHFQTSFNHTFTIQGKLYHRIGNLLPERGAVPKLSQIYFYDSDAQLDYMLLYSGLDPHILKDFQTTLHSVNTYIEFFKTAIEVSAEQSDVKIVLHAEKKTPQNGHARSYNLPTSSEIAALLPGDSTGNLETILRCREGDGQELKRINTCHRSYDPLHYILMFSTGCDDWHLGLNRTDNNKLTAADFYKSRLQIRHEDFNIVSKGKKLTQQYAVDQWAKVEAGRLDWVRKNKKNNIMS
ncbi:ATP-dependent DNA helicase PIF1 [Elysia marginata]|uniref:ATP-dependent DNA helicase PIF1 n=1 Tax=Elysia marginata TaxID=1093978 RepID=A0AAV4IJ11_9GAST|nr:ATP-dependent DNA helicase PIF1 [Elysia marginata]